MMFVAWLFTIVHVTFYSSLITHEFSGALLWVIVVCLLTIKLLSSSLIIRLTLLMIRLTVLMIHFTLLNLLFIGLVRVISIAMIVCSDRLMKVLFMVASLSRRVGRELFLALVGLLVLLLCLFLELILLRLLIKWTVMCHQLTWLL